MKNQPFNVLRHSQWDHAPRMPQVIAGAIIGAVGATGLAATAITVGTYVGVSLITSYAMKALAPKPPELSSFGGDTSSRGVLVNQKDPLSAHDFVYGQTRKGGAITYYETTGSDNKFLHQIIALAGHELEEIGDIYLNDEVVTLDGSGFVTSQSWNSKIRIKKVLGTEDQAADPDLLAESNQITSEFRGRGVAYLYVRYEYDQDAFPNGLPLVTAVVKGKKVYDPRTTTTAYSNNAALCVRDFITSAYGLSDDQIDDTVFSAAAHICDENVTLAGSGTEKKYTINGITRADINYGDVLGDMMTACAGSLFWGAGKWKLTVGDYTAPTKTLTLDDLRGPINLATRVNLRDQFNIVKGTFNDASERWIVTDYPEVKGNTFVTEDGGQETSLDLRLPYTTSSATAQRLAKLTLYRGREQMTFTADFGLNAFDVEVGEIIALTNDRYGWTEKEFEVVGWSFGASDAGALTVSLTLRETSESAFDWTAEEIELIQNNTNLGSAFDVQTPALDAAVAGTSVNNDGTTFPQVSFSWSVDEPELVDYYDFQFKLSTEVNYNSVVVKQVGNFILSPAISGAAYDYRVRAVNVLGVKSAFASSASPVSTGDDGTTPNAPTNLVAAAGPESIKLTWDAPTQNTDTSALRDLFQYRIYRSESNNFSGAFLIGRLSGDIFTDGSLIGGNTYYYWVSAVDFTGNESAPSAVASAIAGVIETERTQAVWFIGVSSLPTTSSGANTDFVNATGEDPVDRDQAWFYTGTQANPTAQSVWIYEDATSTWNEQEEVIDGDLVVSGTITADKLNVTQLDAISATIGTFSSAASGERVVITDSKIEVYDASNNLRVKIGDLS